MSEKGISESSPSGDSQNEEANWGRRELLIVVIQVLLVSAISGGIGGCSAVLEEIPQAPIGELIDAFAIGLPSSMLSAACLIILSVALLWLAGVINKNRDLKPMQVDVDTGTKKLIFFIAIFVSGFVMLIYTLWFVSTCK